jgi:hypothetical protein
LFNLWFLRFLMPLISPPIVQRPLGRGLDTVEMTRSPLAFYLEFPTVNNPLGTDEILTSTSSTLQDKKKNHLKLGTPC